MQAALPALPAVLSHAYVIGGGSGASRRAYAKRLAAAWLCRGEVKPCGRCIACEKVDRDIHPDVIWVTPQEDKKEIMVGDARQARSDVYIRPNEGARKVYIIDPADTMKDAAQDVLLKVLEDGPEHAAFALLCQQPGRLLETVRSRCESILLPPEEVELDPEIRRRGEELAALLLRGSEWELARYLTGLEQERLTTAQALEVFSAAELAVAGELADSRLAVPVLTALKRCREASVYNPGAGHLFGWLCAERFR